MLKRFNGGTGCTHTREVEGPGKKGACGVQTYSYVRMSDDMRHVMIV